MTPAAWLLDLSGQVPPSVSLYGTDISSRLFPLDPAPNIHLSTDSVTKLPISWSSTFTLVHQRLLVLGLTLSEWKAALKEIYQILVPGGWINLFEILLDASQWRWKTGPATTKLFELVCAVCFSKGLVPDIPSHLPALLEEAGFVNIRTEERPASMYGEDGAGMRDNVHKVLMGMKKPVMDAGGMGFVNSREEYEDLTNATITEWSETPAAVTHPFMVYAQKPPPDS
jgi:hypothetical protein